MTEVTFLRCRVWIDSLHTDPVHLSLSDDNFGFYLDT